MIIFVTLQGVGSEMNDPFEAYRKSKSYSFIGSRIGKYFSQLISENFQDSLVFNDRPPVIAGSGLLRKRFHVRGFSRIP